MVYFTIFVQFARILLYFSYILHEKRYCNNYVYFYIKGKSTKWPFYEYEYKYDLTLNDTKVKKTDEIVDGANYVLDVTEVSNEIK